MRKTLIGILCIAFFCVSGIAQKTTITGRVTDSSGAGIPGASVRQQGAKTGVSADNNGSFSLSTTPGTTLIFSAIGFQEIEQPASNGMVVILQVANQNLTEVVVTALGIKRQPRELGYATSRVTNAELIQGRAVNLQNGLTGKVSGLNVTTVNSGVFEESKIILRGVRSLTGNNQPLLVVDAIPTPLGFISSINPNDVGDVTILKGASAAALYGPDGVNGVIIVTTKRGNSKQPVVSVSHTAQVSRVSFLPDIQYRFGSGSSEDQFGRPEYTPYENQQYGPAFNGEIVDLGRPLKNGDVQRVPYSPLKDEKRKFWNNGVTLQTDVSFSNKDFYISAQDVDIKGLTPKDKNHRTSFRFNATREYNKFSAGVNVNYIQNNFDIVNNAGYANRFASSYNGSVYFTVLNTPGQVPLTSYKDQNNVYAQYSNYYNEYFVSPYWVIDNNRQRGRNDNILGSIQLDYRFNSWINATYRAGANVTFGSYKSETAPIFVSEFAQSTRGQQYRNQPGAVEDGSNFSSRITHEFFLNGRSNPEADLGFNYVVGGRFRDDYSKFINAAAGSLFVPYTYNLSNISGIPTANEGNFSNRLYSLFGQVGFNYKRWANVEFVAANDWDSRLRLNEESDISFFYPGVNVSVVLTDAIPGLKNNFLSYAKLRGSLSKSANVNLGVYALEAIYSQTGGFPYGNTGGFSAGNTKPDQNIKPEFVNSREVGIELGFFNNRVNLDATYFNQRNTDQILTVQQSWTTGYPTRLANSADFDNYGVELDLNLTPVVKFGRNGRLNLRTQLTYNDNKIKKLSQGIDELNIGGVTGFTQRAASSPEAYNYAIVGLPAFVFKLSDYERDPEGRVIVDRATGNPQISDSLVTRGRTLPTYIWGINPTFNWKGLTVGMTWEYRGGHYVYHGIGSDMDFTGISERSAQFDRQRFVFPNSVYDDGTGKYVPNENIQVSNGGINFWTSGALNSSVATNYLSSAAFWKLRELLIAYDLSGRWIGANNLVKKLSIAAVGRNLFTFLPKSNQWTDPEFNYSSTGNTFGINSVFQTPPARIFGGTVTVTF
ncbi:MAG: SusC/RagA family TonB-linked outer membrane protein [Bacteroidota bacterium]